MLSRFVVVVVALAGCESSAGDAEQRFVAKEMTDLRAALAARDEVKVLTGCTIVTTGLPRAPAKLADEIKQLCYVDAARLHLELAVAKVKESNAKHPDPELREINCMQLFVEDAFKAIAAHPSDDPARKALAAEYAQLCPAEVAKFATKK